MGIRVALHILGHEENDMMRPLLLNVTSINPGNPEYTNGAPVLSVSAAALPFVLNWTDPTPVLPRAPVTGVPANLAIPPTKSDSASSGPWVRVRFRS